MKTVIPMRRGIRVFLLLSFIFMGNINNMFAQEPFICASPDPTDADNYSYMSHSITTEYMENDPVVFSMFFWGVKAPDGYSAAPLTETKALEMIQILNVEFNQYNIFFKYVGFDTFNSRPNLPEYNSDCSIVVDTMGNPVIDPYGYGKLHLCEYSQFLVDAYNDGNLRIDAFNIYVPFEANGFGGYGGSPYNVIIPTGNLNKKGLVIHEIGHTLGLWHTFSGYTNTHNPNGSPSWDAEHVERNSTSSNFNADTYGDRITDTAAVPQFSNEYCYFVDPQADCSSGSQYYYYYIESDCSYNNDLSLNGDHLDYEYQIFPEDVQNYMSYSPTGCTNQFSPGQVNAMWDRIATFYTNVNYQHLFNTIESLYQPYKGTYSETAGLVGPEIPPHFQPGFDYRFRECGPEGDYPPPIDYYDTSFYLIVNQGAPYYFISKDVLPQNYGTIIHYNHYAITIDQLVLFDDRAARCCYSVSGSPGIADDGAVIKFNDGVFNTNVTVMPQDSTGINNPALINTLDPGLYKIEKNYNNGSTEETVILKDNN